LSRFVRFEHGSTIAYGREENGTVHTLEGSLFDHQETGTSLPLNRVKLLYPCTPTNVFCVGLNYRSHIGSRPTPANPEVFYKPLGCLQHPGGPVLIPPGATDLHYEGELVLVIGKRTRNASKKEARESIFGVTCGNDISERQWQGGPKHDRQWWRAKGSETFGPFGPAIVTGLPYDNLKLETRLNGEVVQAQSTSDLLFDCATMVSYISEYITLEQGDIIYTGTPGNTRPMKAGDVVEVELEGIGVLSNTIVDRI
jgi:2-keto-4-pentenoate hydratase/2-oxohepta-3-ene-1,7-dioic acid hydratase in catechol pathway